MDDELLLAVAELVEALGGGKRLEDAEKTAEISVEDRETLVESLETFINGESGKEVLRKCYEYIMTNENCQFCRTMIASAYSEAEFGNLEKARFIALEVLKVYKNYLIPREKEREREEEEGGGDESGRGRGGNN
ncbi:hypothetical protein DRJ16_02665 [Candidatus Woesearchaeota archaeon]|nr:MAG: hypothetical protein DRJ16_02665 [Candidatus Woesearchaeota archaeon]